MLGFPTLPVEEVCRFFSLPLVYGCTPVFACKLQMEIFSNFKFCLDLFQRLFFYANNIPQIYFNDSSSTLKKINILQIYINDSSSKLTIFPHGIVQLFSCPYVADPKTSREWVARFNNLLGKKENWLYNNDMKDLRTPIATWKLSSNIDV